MAALRLLVGLGNPGAEHMHVNPAQCRVLGLLTPWHGARACVSATRASCTARSAKIIVDGEPLWLFKPTTFMNKSGIALAAALRYWKIETEEMLVAHDDLDYTRPAPRD